MKSCRVSEMPTKHSIRGRRNVPVPARAVQAHHLFPPICLREITVHSSPPTCFALRSIPSANHASTSGTDRSHGCTCPRFTVRHRLGSNPHAVAEKSLALPPAAKRPSIALGEWREGEILYNPRHPSHIRSLVSASESDRLTITIRETYQQPGCRPAESH